MAYKNVRESKSEKKKPVKSRIDVSDYGPVADFVDYSLVYKILLKIGKETQIRYNRNLYHGAGGYNLSKLKDSLKFIPDLQNFENNYYLEGKTEELTKLAYYFEYGTGLFNTRSKKGYIRPINYEYMMWKDPETGALIKAKKTKGVKPVFAMTKAIASVKHDEESIVSKFLDKLAREIGRQGDKEND
jgi:hypothetical protein